MRVRDFNKTFINLVLETTQWSYLKSGNLNFKIVKFFIFLSIK